MYESRSFSRALPADSMVPKSQLGPELVINGDFSTDTGWTLIGGATIAGGVLALDGIGTGVCSRDASDTITAGTYRVAFDVVATDGNNEIQMRVGGTNKFAVGSDAVGSIVDTVVTAAATQVVALAATEVVVQIDNFSVKRVL